MKTCNKGQTTGQKFGFQKQLWKFTAIALNKIIKELNQRNRRRRLRSYGLVNLVGLSKIYSCWFIPDFTRNHVISYTNESRRFLTLITIVAFKSRSINTQTLIVPVLQGFSLQAFLGRKGKEKFKMMFWQANKFFPCVCRPHLQWCAYVSCMQFHFLGYVLDVSWFHPSALVVLECTLNLLFASAFVALFPRKVVGDIRGCSRYIYSRCERVI